MIGYYNIGKRSRKWWKRVFAYLVKVSILNSYCLYKHTHTGSARLDYLGFRFQLAEEMIGTFRGRSHVGRPRSSESLELERLNVSLGHWPSSVAKCLEYVACNKVREIKN